MTSPLDGQTPSLLRLAASNAEPEKSPFAHVKPCLEPVSAAALLDDLVREINRFIVCDVEVAQAAALWIVSTWMRTVKYAPILHISSSVGQCGNSTFLDVLNCFVYRPVRSNCAETKTLLSLIKKYQPTILVDNSDVVLDKKSINLLETLVNTEHQYWIEDDDQHNKFKAYTNRATAGIGFLPQKLHNKSISLKLTKKDKAINVASVYDVKPSYFEYVQSKILRLANTFEEFLPEIQAQIANQMPDELDDSQKNCWLAIFALAKFASDDWYKKAVLAAIKIHACSVKVDGSVALLRDIRSKLAGYKDYVISREKLMNLLMADDELKWSTYQNNNYPISPYQFSTMLKDFELKSKQIKINGQPQRVFKVEQLNRAFELHLKTPVTPVTPLPSNTGAAQKVTGVFGDPLPAVTGVTPVSILPTPDEQDISELFGG